MASAKKIRDEIMSMTIVVNSNPAQQEIYKLTQKNKELTSESKALNKEREKIATTLGEESQEYKDLTQKINDNNNAVTVNKNKVQDLTDSLDINQMTVKQLRQELSQLNRALNDRVVPGTEQFDALQKRIAEVRDRIKEVRNGADDSEKGFDKVSDVFNEYAGVAAAVVGTLAGVTLSIQEVIDRNNEMADAMSGVEKTTGMTTAEVKELSNAFTDFDTRTKKIDLLKIAEVGGRLGVAKTEILDFTKEVDKAYVALGDSWKGGVDDLADSLGKIASLYKETKDQPIAQSINEVGSALNELAAQGASSEQNIANFVNRLGSMPPAMKPALNTLLGFGSAFEESGIDAEIASSGFSKFIRVASSNAAGFAHVMKEPVAKVKEMINSDPAEFFLKFSEGLNGLDADQVSGILDYLKLSDNEVQRAIGAATENTDKFRESVSVANKAVKEGTSLTDEFNKVNNNAAAIYEKVQKKFKESLTSQAIAEFLEKAVNAFGKFIGVVADGEGTITNYRNLLIFLVKAFIIFGTTLISYNFAIGAYNALLTTSVERIMGLTVAKKALSVVTAIENGILNVQNAIVGYLQLGYARLTRNTDLQTAAQERLNLVTKANPYGAMFALITALVTAYFLFADHTDVLKNKQAELNKVLDDGVKNAGAEVSALDALYSKAMKAKEGTDARRIAIEELKKQFPSYFGSLDAETAKNEDLRKSYLSLRDAIVASARAKAIDAELQRRSSERLARDEANKRKLDQYLEDYKNPQGGTYGGGGGIIGTNMPKEYTKEDAKKSAAIAYYKQLKYIRDLQKKDLEEDSDLIDLKENNLKASEKYNKDLENRKKEDAKGSNYTDIAKEKELADAEKERKKAEKERLAAEKKAAREAQQEEDKKNKILKDTEAATQLESDLELAKSDSVIAAMKEGFEKEMAEINLQEKRKKAELDKKKKGQTEIDILEKDMKTAVGANKAFGTALLKMWKTDNEAIEKAKQGIQAQFDVKRKALRTKHDLDELKNIETTHQNEVNALQRQKNDELAKYQTLADLKAGLQDRISKTELNKIRTWQDGKDVLTKVYQKKEIDLQVGHLQAMLELYKGLDLSILTKEQREQVLKFIDEASTKLSELKSKKTENKVKTSEDDKKKTALGNQGSTDILGMSYDDWETFFSNLDTGANKLGTISAAIGALQNAFSTYYQFVQAKEQAQMQQVDSNAKRKELRLKKMLDKGLINQEQYDAEVQKLNQETELEKWKLEYAAAKRQRTFMIGQTIANTAMAIMNIWATSSNPWVAAAMSVVVGALGAVQVATIAKQPLPEAPGFEDGFGMDYEMERSQDRKKFNVVRKPLRSGPVYRPTHFIAGENNKVEMVIDNQTYKGFSPSFRKALHNEIAYSRGSQGFEGGYYPYLSQKQDSKEEMYVEVISNNTAAMNAVVNKDFKSYIVKSMDSAKIIIEMTDEYNSYKNSAEK